MLLKEYFLEIVYHEGEENTGADFLFSNLLIHETEIENKIFP